MKLSTEELLMVVDVLSREQRLCEMTKQNIRLELGKRMATAQKNAAQTRADMEEAKKEAVQ